jgi:hypothetical protein
MHYNAAGFVLFHTSLFQESYIYIYICVCVCVCVVSLHYWKGW